LTAALPYNDIAFLGASASTAKMGAGLKRHARLPLGADVVVLCLGESASMSGEAASRAAPGLLDRQRELAEAVLATGACRRASLFGPPTAAMRAPEKWRGRRSRLAIL